MGTFAEALRALLTERQVSQRELARRLGISAQAVNGWLNAGVTPSRDNVTRTEDELAVEPRGYLLTAAGYSLNADPEAPTIESLIRADPDLDPEDKRVLLRILRVLRERHAETDQSILESH